MTEDFGDSHTVSAASSAPVPASSSRGKPLIDDAREVLRRRVDPFAERRNIVQIIMVVVVQNGGKRLLCDLKVDQHSEIVELRPAKCRLDHPIMTMQTVAFPRVIDHPVRRLKSALNAQCVHKVSFTEKTAA